MNEHTTEAVQDGLFPLAELQTKGYAKPETDDQQVEAADGTVTEEAA